MKRRWPLLAAFAGLLALVAVLFWPVRPLWQISLDRYAQPISFTRDGHMLLVATDQSTHSSTEGTSNQLTIYRFGAMTGHPFAPAVAIPIKSAANGFVSSIIASPNGERIIIGIQIGRITHHYTLHDLTTGRTVSLPDDLWNDHTWISSKDFSPDGRWLYIFRETREEETLKVLLEGISILDATTGERVLSFVSDRSTKSQSYAFSPDSFAFVVLDIPGRFKPSRMTIYELPSGAIRQQFSLPRELLWDRIDEWYPGKLYVGTGSQSWHTTFWFDPDAPNPGEGHPMPLASSDTNAGHHAACPLEDAYYDFEPELSPPWMETQLAKLKRDCGWSWLSVREGHLLNFFNAEGQARRDRVPRMPYPCVIEPHGRLVACMVEGRLEVWDADPTPRWPWALLAGVGAMLPVLLRGHFRRINT